MVLVPYWEFWALLGALGRVSVPYWEHWDGSQSLTGSTGRDEGSQSLTGSTGRGLRPLLGGMKGLSALLGALEGVSGPYWEG